MNNDSLDWYDPIIEDLPEHLAGSDSWAGHIPFAFYLMAALRPARVVELGVFAGNSLFAFAQAAHTLGHPVRISGVDTWESDPHSGGYDGAVVYQAVLEQQARYPDRVELHRASFDQARVGFAPESVDLLHIDGYHHYEAVSHDFLTWRETLTSEGVVLFHDTAVQRDDFGVWRFWDEIKREYGPEQTLEFTHSNGLGCSCWPRPIAIRNGCRRCWGLPERTGNGADAVQAGRAAGPGRVCARERQQRQARERIAGLEEASANWQREALHQQQEARIGELAARRRRASSRRCCTKVLRQQLLPAGMPAIGAWTASDARLDIYQSKSWRLTAPLRLMRRYPSVSDLGPFM
jgi:hypothetical protein